jgi:hypothetical protein
VFDGGANFAQRCIEFDLAGVEIGTATGGVHSTHQIGRVHVATPHTNWVDGRQGEDSLMAFGARATLTPPTVWPVTTVAGHVTTGRVLFRVGISSTLCTCVKTSVTMHWPGRC